MNSQLPDLAQRQLDALRAAVDVRLSALEAALADPTRAGSLEALILDLARVATEEAQAAASKACVDTKLEVETQIVRAMTSAQAAIQEERTAAADLRRAVEQTRQRIARLESDKQTEIRNLRAGFDAQVARDREAAGKLQRAVAEIQSQLEAERRVAGELRRAVEDAKGLSAALAQEKARGLELGQSLAGVERLLEGARADVARANEKAAGLERNLVDTQSQLETERQAARELRQAVEDAKGLSAAALAQEKARGLELEQSLAGLGRLLEGARADVEHEHEKAGSLERILADTESQLEAERQATAEVRRALEDAEARSTTVAREKGETLAAREELASRLSRETEAVARLQQGLAEAQSQLEFERTSSVELRQAADRVAERLTTIGPEISRILEAHDTLSAELSAERGRGAHLQRAHDEARAELEAARTRVDAFENERAAPGDNKTETTQRWTKRKRAADPWTASVAPVTREGWTSVRLADRFVFREPIDIQINGEPGVLLDLSVAGCQLVSRSTLRPNQVLKVALPSDGAPITCTGKVVWARLEPSGYRAGIQFKKPDELAIEAFAAGKATV